MGPESIFPAIDEGDLDLIEALGASPATHAVRSERNETPALYALYRGNRTVAQLLARKQPVLDLPTAAACCTAQEVREALNAGGQVHGLSPDGFTPLCLAAAFNHEPVLRALLEAGADPNLRSEALGGVAPIHAAVFGRSEDSVRVLIEQGADIDALQEGGFTALHGAAQNGDRSIVVALLSARANRSLRSADGKSAADHARDAGHIEVAELLR